MQAHGDGARDERVQDHVQAIPRHGQSERVKDLKKLKMCLLHAFFAGSVPRRLAQRSSRKLQPSQQWELCKKYLSINAYLV